jgi:acetyl-CoA carboxylase carboxyl transferase subunit beta
MSNDGRRWFETRKDFVGTPREAGNDAPDLFTRCPSCTEAIYNEVVEQNLSLCPACGHHFRLGALARLAMFCDLDEVEMHDQHLFPVDALGFVDSKPYTLRIAQAHKKTSMNDAFISASGELDGVPVEIGIFDFRYMGGSMGSVVGEMITRLFERATDRKRAAIVVSASGGARMQEGVLSLMQMAKTSAALTMLQDAGLPYISILTHPTTGGVAASFAMLGDVIIAEPEALIGFAGPRVIEQTIGESLPEGFQTSEYLLAHGMLDRIVPRAELAEVVGRLIRQFQGLPPTSHLKVARETNLAAANAKQTEAKPS